MKVVRYNGRRNISGEQIREARLRLRLSQAQLAARMQTEGIRAGSRAGTDWCRTLNSRRWPGACA